MVRSAKLLQRFLKVEKPLSLADFQEISYSVLSGGEKSVDASAVRGSQSSLREAVASPDSEGLPAGWLGFRHQNFGACCPRLWLQAKKTLAMLFSTPNAAKEPPR